jgi:hypothetical protein
VDLGACSRCAAPYTASDVAGLGILRARPEAQGGPRVEYRCPRCGRIEVLVPHGEGRYARPGAAPPDEVPPAARRPAWVGAVSADPSRHEPDRPHRAPPSPPSAATGEIGRALELLGVLGAASPEEIERAYRLKSLACHPDKVAHLDADLQRLAEEKFKRLQEARRLLLG